MLTAVWQRWDEAATLKELARSYNVAGNHFEAGGMSTRRSRWILLCCLAMPITSASAEGLSGTFVGKASNGAFLVQLVETGDGHLTGRYEQVLLQPGGKVDDMNAVITGAADGQTVVVTIKPSEFLSGTIAASGTIEGRLLHLSGGGNGGNLNLNLLRSDEADSRAQVAALTEQARQINNARLQQEAAQRKAKIEADQLANLQSLTQRMIVFTTKADAILPKFAPVEQRYHDITQRMRGALAREQSIYGGGQASVARGQISVAINQAAIQANQIHIGIGSSYQAFDSDSGQLSRESAGASQGCRGAHVATDAAPIPVGYEARNAACLRFLDVAKDYEQRVSDLRAAFSKAETIWNAERREQDQTVQASNAAVQ